MNSEAVVRYHKAFAGAVDIEIVVQDTSTRAALDRVMDWVHANCTVPVKKL